MWSKVALQVRVSSNAGGQPAKSISDCDHLSQHSQLNITQTRNVLITTAIDGLINIKLIFNSSFQHNYNMFIGYLESGVIIRTDSTQRQSKFCCESCSNWKLLNRSVDELYLKITMSKKVFWKVISIQSRILIIKYIDFKSSNSFLYLILNLHSSKWQNLHAYQQNGYDFTLG